MRHSGKCAKSDSLKSTWWIFHCDAGGYHTIYCWGSQNIFWLAEKWTLPSYQKNALAFRSPKIPSNWDLGWDNLSTSLSSTFDPSSTLKESGSNSEPRSAKPQEVHWSWEKRVRISSLALWFGIPNVPPISNLEGLCEDDQSITWGVGWNLTPPVTH